MYCPNCGNQLPDGSKFCDVCGTRLDTAPAYDSNYNQQSAAGYGANYNQQPAQGYSNDYSNQQPTAGYGANYNQQPAQGYSNDYNQQPNAGYNNYNQQPAPGYSNTYNQQQAQGYPQDNTQGYSGYNATAPEPQTGNGEIPVNRYAWIIGAGTLIMLVITVIIAFITEGDDEAVESLSYVLSVAKIILLWMDSREIKKCGYKISPLWYILGFFCAGPYLFVRAKQIDKNFKYFYLWIASVVVMLVIFVVLLPMIL